jgi:DNA-binding beta-propeller fold protein YncE
MEWKLPVPQRTCVLLATLMLTAAAARTAHAAPPTIANLHTITPLSTTVPGNGDVNPYGVAQIPVTKGHLVAGKFLISNFNNSGNTQGTGTTIVEIGPNGSFDLFAQIDPTKVSCPGGIGLSTALVALRSGFVVVGSLPTANGAISGAGCLIVLDSWGNVVETFAGHGINGPWDMTAVDGGFIAALFVTNVLDGTVAANGSVVHRGNVERLLLVVPEGHAPLLAESTVIASGFPQRTDVNALVIGATGVAFDDDSGILYVTDPLDNRIAAIPDALFRFASAGTGFTVFEGGSLNGPLGLALTPDGDLIAANGDDGNLVEINPRTGKQVATNLVDDTPGTPPGAGALFGLLATREGVYFVDDDSNTLNLLH